MPAAAVCARQMVEGRPRRLGVDVVAGDRRNAAPIVDAGRDHLGQARRVQIRRRLDIHLGTEDQPGDGDRPQMVVEIGFGRVRHPGPRLGPEILDDDFLDVAVAVVEIAQRQQRLDAFAPGFADADQDAGGERHRRFAGHRGSFRGALPDPCRASRNAGPPRWRKPLGCAFQHDPLRRPRPCAAASMSARVIMPGVQMRQQPGFAQHQRSHLGEV